MKTHTHMYVANTGRLKHIYMGVGRIVSRGGTGRFFLGVAKVAKFDFSHSKPRK